MNPGRSRGNILIYRPWIVPGALYGPGSASGRLNEQFAFPVDKDKLDGRLSASEIVLTVEIGDAITAFPLGDIDGGAINGEVGG